MICVNSVSVYPSRVSVKAGEWYRGAYAEISPKNASDPTVTWSSSNPSIATVNPDTGYIKGINPGTATIYATALDGSGKRDSCTVAVSENIHVSSITLNATNMTMNKGSYYTLSATVSPANATNKSVYWCSDNPDVATVSNGVVHAISTGNAEITAYAADGSTARAHCQVNVYENIPVRSVTVSPSCRNMYVGESAYLHATVCPSNATNQLVAWSSSDKNIAAINPNSGLVTALSKGTTTIWAITQDGSNKSGTCTVTVSGGIIPVTSINIKLTSVKLQKGTCRKLAYTMTPSNATYPTVLWESSNTDVATVEKDGTVYAKSAGIADIVAYATDGSGIEDTCRVTVTEDTLVTSVTVNPACQSMVVGESTYLHVTVYPENATNKNVFWESLNQDVAVVNPNSGLVIAQGPGVTTIRVMTQDGSGKEASCRVTVEAVVPVSSVAVSPKTGTMLVGESMCLCATVLPANATNKAVRWSSSNTSVAYVDYYSGRVYAKAPGTAIIYAGAQDESGKKGYCTVNVTPNYQNNLFDITKIDDIKAEFVALLGNKKVDIPALDLFYVHTTSECVDIVIDNDITITNFSNCFGIPKSLIQTILLRELWCLNLADSAGDSLVENYFSWKESCEYWENQSLAYQAIVPYPSAPIPLKTDSSTGLGQIFANVAIKAYNEAIDYGYISSGKFDNTDWKVCKEVWYLLKDDNEYNIQMTTLNILSCINEYDYGSNYYEYTPIQYKQIFTRYNANQDTVNDYGEECYEYFLIFKKYM